MIKLKLLLEQIIKEVGEIDKIEPYSWEKISNIKYKFFDKDGDLINVIFNKYSKDDIEYILNKSKALPNSNEYYNVSYNIEEKETQYKKDNYLSLLKIIKTVYDIIKDFINNKDISGLTFFARNKNEDFFLSKTDPQKEMLYKAVLLKNIQNFPGWSFVDSNLDDDFKGFIFYKK